MKSFLKIILVIIICIGILVMSGMRVKDIHENNNKYTTTNIAMLEKVVKVNTITNNNVEENSTILLNVEKPIKTNRQVNDWKLVLVNFEHALPENFEIVNLLPFGYPAEDALPSVKHEERKELQETVFWNEF